MNETGPRDVTRIAAASAPASTRPQANDPDATAPLSRPPVGDPDATLLKPSEGVPAAVTVPGYELLGVLGRGGMGVVYKARHLALKRTVALKMVLGGGHAGPGERARFRTEAEAVARLQHPNIVQIYEVGESDGRPYFALEFVPGGTLAGKLAGKPLPPAESARLVEALARAMHLAHSRNVVHRDLKPGNVLMAADGTPKITDFGLARRLDADAGETHTGAVMGTPSYMAPEQAAGRTHEAGPAADVYALGAILYACLSGRPPFRGATSVETLDLVRTAEPVPPSRSHAVPPDLETICLKCLQKRPEHRYPSAAELADDLGRWGRGEPILARPVGTPERAVKWARRHPTAAVLVTVFAVLLGVVPTAAVLIAERERQSAEALSATNADLVRNQENLVREQAAKDAEQKQKLVGKARLALTLALNYCDQGDTSRGLVALTHALAAAVVAEDADLESAVRFNLAAWERQTWQLRSFLPAPPGVQIQAAALHPEGTVLAVALKNQTVQLWDATVGKEGRLLHTLSHEGDAVLTSHSVEFSADGRLLLAHADQAVHLWNVETGRPACPPLRHDARVSAVALDPKGKAILTGDDKGVTRLWDAGTGKVRGEPLVQKSPTDAAAFRDDGLKAITGSRDGRVRVWDVETGKVEGEGFVVKGGGVTTVQFSRSGKTALVGTRSAFTTGTVHLLNVETGTAVVPPLACDGPVKEVAFGAGETAVVVRTGLSIATATARIWWPGSNLPATPLAHPGDVLAFALTPDGNTLVTAGSGGSIRFWEVSGGRAAGPPLYHDGQAGALAFSRDGRTLVTLDGEVRLWRAPLTVRRAVLKHADQVTAVVFSGDGRLVLTGSKDGTARLWHAATGEPAADPLRHGGEVTSVAFSPDGSLALTGGDTRACLWETKSGKGRDPLVGHQAAITAVAFSPDGAVALTGSYDGSARLWSVDTGRPLGDPLRHQGAVQAVAFSPDGDLVLTGSEDKSACVWRVRTRERVGGPLTHSQAVASVVFSRDGLTAYTGGRSGAEISCWDTATGRAKAGLPGHQEGVWALATSPGATLLLSGGADRTARFWSTETGKQIGSPVQHQDVVRDVTFGPEGRTALTGSYDTSARRWHAPSGIPVGPPLLHRGKVRAVALSPDGRTAGTASWDGTAVLWEAPPEKPGTTERLAAWAAAAIGIDLDDRGTVIPLTADAWKLRAQGLRAMTIVPAE